MKAIKVGDNVVLVLDKTEVSYLHHRLATSSFSTFAEYRNKTAGVPHITRKTFAADFDAVVKGC